MIENDLQYGVTKGQAAKFEEALKAFDEEAARDTTTHPILKKAQKDALQSQLDDLNEELRAYENRQGVSG